MSELYSCYYLDKEKSGRLDINPGFMAKGICQAMGISFLSDDEIEYDLRNIRRMLFDDTENGCYFAVRQKLRESAFVSYEVVDIVRDGEEETLATDRPIGHNLGKSERIMTEEDLYQRCCNYRNLKDEKVDMRRNLVDISGPSGVGKDTIVKELLARYPNINKTVSVTTRTKRSKETDGVDYYIKFYADVSKKSYSSAKNCRVILLTALRYAVGKKLISENPAEDLYVPKSEKDKQGKNKRNIGPSILIFKRL